MTEYQPNLFVWVEHEQYIINDEKTIEIRREDE